MNPLPINPILLFELGLILMTTSLAICNWKRIKAILRRFWQYLRKGDVDDIKTYTLLLYVLMVVVVLIIEGLY